MHTYMFVYSIFVYIHVCIHTCLYSSIFYQIAFTCTNGEGFMIGQKFTYAKVQGWLTASIIELVACKGCLSREV